MFNEEVRILETASAPVKMTDEILVIVLLQVVQNVL